MNSEYDNVLTQVDQWKFRLHEKLKGMTGAQRKAFWKLIHKQARRDGLPTVELVKPAKWSDMYNRQE